MGHALFAGLILCDVEGSVLSVVVVNTRFTGRASIYISCTIGSSLVRCSEASNTNITHSSGVYHVYAQRGHCQSIAIILYHPKQEPQVVAQDIQWYH